MKQLHTLDRVFAYSEKKEKKEDEKVDETFSKR